mmetsp:Transcript_23507/g.37615  ORF Transcript_23507/g.37615 Transcript_23507/m.37615 type:complete len:235 (-) Transcript_23507:11-715(-)
MAETDRLNRSGLLKNVDAEIRSGFIQKVYCILSAQIFVTALVAAPFIFSPPVREFMRAYGQPVFWIAIIANMAVYCTMICKKDAMRKVPDNYIFLSLFTVTEGILVGVICSRYTIASVLFAVAATAVLVACLTAYAFYTKTDFSDMGGYLFAALVVLMIFGLFCMFLPFPFMHKVYSCLCILLFSFFLIYDTQLICGGGKVEIGIDDYVFGALMLYIDIIELFLNILALFGDRN